MSIQNIHKYYKDVEDLVKYGGKTNEAVISHKFGDLINIYCERRNLKLIPQLPIKTTKGATITPDGTINNSLRVQFGYWESKANVDLYEEIGKKIKAGYPLSNTLFEDGKTAILYQKGNEVGKAKIADAEKLHQILSDFTGYERPEVKAFNQAIEQFKQDLPHVLDGLRDKINEQQVTNVLFIAARDKFLELCKESINPEITIADVNEMLLQHILTEEIFVSIFSDAQFHRENNIAKELYKVEETFFTGKTKKDTLESISSYYEVIKANASSFADHHEKQRFLKVIYENFYKAYNPKSADRLGIVYTPNEIVKFQIESVDYLLQKHFGKHLHEKNVEILDPCTGTGTYITDIIEYIPRQYLKYKFQNEIHANEISLLPYYIANLNIEYTYQSRMNEYEEFINMCWMDTLDNVAFRNVSKNVDLFKTVSLENTERIQRQNKRKISVIIGNPPYNAKQENYNMQNANRFYEHIDKRIKETYIKQGTAQNQIVVYDMYTRFYRWASDRLDNNGVIAFVTNRSFIDSRSFDGFRKCIQDEFDECYIYDTRSDVRTNPKIAGTTHNVFGIQTGVAILFLVKKETDKKQPCKIHYYNLQDEQRKEEKLEIIKESHISTIPFENIKPDPKNNWINISDNDFDELLPLIDKEVKTGKSGKALFKAFSRGIASQRDEWVYDFSEKHLITKMKFFADVYAKTFVDKDYKGKFEIKWDRELTNYLNRGVEKTFNKKSIISSLYRPYTKMYLYFDKHFNGMTYQWFEIYLKQNKYIAFNAPGSSKDFHCLGSDSLIDLHLTGDSQCLPFYILDKTKKQIENITDWGLEQFCNHYIAKPKREIKLDTIDISDKADISNEHLGKPLKEYDQSHLDSNEGQMLHEPEPDVSYVLAISKEDIFHYTYAVLHNPAYRKKYELNLKREFPRLPFYEDFAQWAAWGKKLMDLHINYENVIPYEKLDRVDVSEKKNKEKVLIHQPEIYTAKGAIKPKLKANKTDGIIEIDELTTISGIPVEAWQYKLGNRSALEWVLDQYKEYKSNDPTIAEKFNTYRFADYKEHVIDLLMRVTTVSVETMKIIKGMEA